MKILVTGSRYLYDDQLIYNGFEFLQDKYTLLPEETYIVHGSQRGVDQTVDEVCKKRFQFRVIGYPAIWGKYNKGAGAIRNREMCDKEKPDIVVAFHENIQESKGTKDMIKYAISKNILVYLFDHEGNIKILKPKQFEIFE